jgi:hypothetical protein
MDDMLSGHPRTRLLSSPQNSARQTVFDAICRRFIETTQLRLFNTPSARPNIHYEVRYLQGRCDSEEDGPANRQFENLMKWLKDLGMVLPRVGILAPAP